jgi:AcrR family transcriptional regulator
MAQIKDKRKAIMNAALKLIAKNGFHGTSVSQIAAEAGVSVGTIYRYFESKDKLIDELYRSIKLKITQLQVANLDKAQNLSDQLQQFLREFIRYFVFHPHEAAFLEQYTHSPYYHPSKNEVVEQAAQPVMERLQRAKDQKIIKDLPDPVIRVLTENMATSIAHRQASGFIHLTDLLIDQIISASWDAIRLL